MFSVLSKQFFLLAIGTVITLVSCSPQPSDSEPPLSFNAFLQAGQSSGFSKATKPMSFDFPADHGSHPTYKTEWWYITGNLKDGHGERFGFQFTLFRNALSHQDVDRASRWATNQVYLAHAAVTDALNNRFYTDERFARGALGLAGAEIDPLKLWLEDWIIKEVPSEGCPECLDLLLFAKTPEFSINLLLRSRERPVLHGDRGLSHKSNTPGNASYYYSLTRLQTSGELRIDERTHTVDGGSWLDHEWSTSALEENQEGWDWFSVQMSDQTELMLFQLRHAQDPSRHYRYGTYSNSDGDLYRLSGGDFSIDALGTWTSPETGVTYPSGWKIAIPSLEMELELSPLTRAQEINHSFRYWEGALDVRGSVSDESVGGHGYAELTGYD